MSLARQSSSRRDFIKASAMSAAGLLSVASRDALASETADFPIVDTHQHLWDLTKFRLGWLKGNQTLDRDFLTADYLKATAAHNVKRAIYMEVDVAADQKAAEAEWVIELCKAGKSPTVAGVIGGDLLSADFGDYIKPFAASPFIKGVRHLLQGYRGDQTCHEEQFVKNVRLLGERKLRFDLGVRPDQLSSAAKLVAKAPETQFVLNHCGNADYQAFLPESKRFRKAEHDADLWRKGMEEIARQPNVICKLSGIIARVKKEAWKPKELAPIVDHCIQSFGFDRVVFASDWPVCLLGAELAAWIDALKELTAVHGAEKQKKIFHDNAVSFYGL